MAVADIRVPLWVRSSRSVGRALQLREETAMDATNDVSLRSRNHGGALSQPSRCPSAQCSVKTTNLLMASPLSRTGVGAVGFSLAARRVASGSRMAPCPVLSALSAGCDSATVLQTFPGAADRTAAPIWLRLIQSERDSGVGRGSKTDQNPTVPKTHQTLRSDSLGKISHCTYGW